MGGDNDHNLAALDSRQKTGAKEQVNKRAWTCPTREQTISKLQQLQQCYTSRVIDKEIKEQNRAQKQIQKIYEYLVYDKDGISSK